MDNVKVSSVKKGSVIGAMFWMFFISLLLFWLPVIGPLIAGLVGGKKAGSIGSALAAVFLPSVVFSIFVFAIASSASSLPFIGLIAGIGGFGLMIAHI